LSTVVIGGGMIRDAGTPAQQGEILRNSSRANAAWRWRITKKGAPLRVGSHQCHGTAAGNEYQLQRQKTIVLDGAVADSAGRVGPRSE